MRTSGLRRAAREGHSRERVRSDYVEKPDDSKLIEAAINGMLSSLDPHPSYLNPKALREMQAQTSGQFGGLGLEVTMEDGVIKVVFSNRRHASGAGRPT
jgi:carboxyl-terminal processing protease